MTIGLAASAAGTLIKGQAQEKAAEAAKASLFTSAAFADAAAADAVSRGQNRDLQLAMRSSAVIADQRVAMSGSGADVNSGGSLQTQLNTGAVSDLDRANVRRNAALAAYGLRMQAQKETQEGLNASAEGSNAETGTFLSGGASIFQQGGKLFSQRPSGGGSDGSFPDVGTSSAFDDISFGGD